MAHWRKPPQSQWERDSRRYLDITAGIAVIAVTLYGVSVLLRVLLDNQ